MHTVVFGWFGGSAVWFIPLLWRLVKSALPGGAGLRGPGTIRLWLGFVCVLVASCTLEASLLRVAGVNGFGHALAAGFGHLLGPIGTPLAALALLLISLPWLIDFRWRDFAAWADGAFGLGLSRGLAKRDEEARRHRSVDDGLPTHVSPPTNTMAPKTNGRYARPTVWRPPARGRDAAAGAGGAAGKDAAARGAGASWRSGAATSRSQTAQAEPVLRTGAASTPPRHVPMQTQSLNPDKAAWMPAEPVAPAGWLRESGARAAVPAAGSMAGTGASGAATRESASQVGRRSAGEQRAAGSVATGATGAAGAGLAAGASAANAATAARAARAAQAAPSRNAMLRSMPGAVSHPSAGAAGNASTRAGRPSTAIQGSAASAASVNHTPTPRQAFSPAPLSADVTPTPATQRPRPSYTRPMPATQKVTPPPSVQETLRSIAENAARWTDLAGVSLARSSSADTPKITNAPDAVPTFEMHQSGGEASRSNAIEAPLTPDVAVTSLEAVENASTDGLVKSPGDTSPMEPAVEVLPQAKHEPVVQWPIEPPIIQPPLPTAPVIEPAFVAVTTPASAAAAPPASQPVSSVATPTPFQIFAAQLQASEADADETPFEDVLAQSSPHADHPASPNVEVAQTLGTAQDHATVVEDKIADVPTTPAIVERVEAATPVGEPQPAAPAPVAAVVIDQPLVPWEAELDAVLSQHAAESSSGLTVDSVAGSAATVEASGVTPSPSAARVGESTAAVQTQTVDSPALPDAASEMSDSLDGTHAASTTTAAPPQTIAPHASNVVRFPGFAVHTSPAASDVVVDEPVALEERVSEAPITPAASAPLAPASLAITPAAAPNPITAQTAAQTAGQAAAETVAPNPAPSTAHTSPAEPVDVPEPAPQRQPPRGHSPANGFEFRAPAASTVELPTLDLLAPADIDVEPVSEEKLIETGLLIEQRLQEFKVPVTVVGASAGPVITRFEVEPALGVRGSQIVGLMKDLSRGLGLTSIRVVETIPGKTCMGLELPNAKRQTIRLSEILEASVYQNSHSQLTLAMGKDITGHPVVADLAKAPHMLVAGTTGSGKSVAINAMICSLLFKATPEEVRLIMIDPKMLELSVYEGIPHLLAPVVTDMKLAANALNWCVGEMEKRYRLMSAVGVRNLAGFNQKIRDTEAKGKKLGNPFSLTPEAPEPLAPLPLIVVVIDELADLMMVAGKKIEELIARLAQKARAAGIHLILATQRPSVDVITGLIKANIPTRVAFQVSSKIDSRTILDQMGAESLLGQGDMLFLPPGTGYPQRVHGAFVADEEVHRIVEYLKQFGEPQYEEGILDGPATEGGAAQDLFGESPDAEADPLYDEAVAFVVRTRRASISSVQRQLRIGYNRAARLVEQMETAGLVSAMGINGSREVLAPGPAE